MVLTRISGSRSLWPGESGIPFFTKQLCDVKGISTINARAESVAKSPTYREPFKKRRCLVPASGFYEWKKLDAKNKQPYQAPTQLHKFALAGVAVGSDDRLHVVGATL
jgi:putative SOS response-associated peptidase YedK